MVRQEDGSTTPERLGLTGRDIVPVSHARVGLSRHFDLLADESHSSIAAFRQWLWGLSPETIPPNANYSKGERGVDLVLTTDPSSENFPAALKGVLPLVSSLATPEPIRIGIHSRPNSPVVVTMIDQSAFESLPEHLDMTELDDLKGIRDNMGEKRGFRFALHKRVKPDGEYQKRRTLETWGTNNPARSVFHNLLHDTYQGANSAFQDQFGLDVMSGVYSLMGEQQMAEATSSVDERRSWAMAVSEVSINLDSTRTELKQRFPKGVTVEIDLRSENTPPILRQVCTDFNMSEDEPVSIQVYYDRYGDLQYLVQPYNLTPDNAGFAFSFDNYKYSFYPITRDSWLEFGQHTTGGERVTNKASGLKRFTPPGFYNESYFDSETNLFYQAIEDAMGKAVLGHQEEPGAAVEVSSDSPGEQKAKIHEISLAAILEQASPDERIKFRKDLELDAEDLAEDIGRVNSVLATLQPHEPVVFLKRREMPDGRYRRDVIISHGGIVLQPSSREGKLGYKDPRAVLSPELWSEQMIEGDGVIEEIVLSPTDLKDIQIVRGKSDRISTKNTLLAGGDAITALGNQLVVENLYSGDIMNALIGTRGMIPRLYATAAKSNTSVGDSVEYYLSHGISQQAHFPIRNLGGLDGVFQEWIAANS